MFGMGLGLGSKRRILLAGELALPYTTNLVLHYDMARSCYADLSFATPVTANGGTVGALRDYSGQNNHAGSNGSDVLLKTNALNGRPSIECDGQAQLLFDNGTITLPNTGYTAIAIAKNTNPAGGIVIGNTASTANYIYFYTTLLHSNAAGNTVATGAVVDGTWIMGMARNRSATTKMWANGVESVASTGPQDFLIDNLGQYSDGLGTNNMIGEIAEIIVYSEGIDDTARVSLENYINSKYAIF